MLISARPLDAQKGVPKVAIKENASPISVFILVSTVLFLIERSRPCLPMIQILSGLDRLLEEMQWPCHFPTYATVTIC